MSVSSKHRRVKSLVREIESGDIVLPASTSASNLSSANGSPNSASGSHTLHTRASTSSLSSQASGATGNTPSTPDTVVSPTNTLNRKTSGNYLAQFGNSNRHLDYGNMPSGSSARSGQRSIGDNDHAPLDTPALEEMEADDVFLPLSSPFSPNYSVSGGSSIPNSPRRNSRLDMGPPPSSSQQMTAAERREHSRKNSTIHTRNLSVFFPRPEQKGLPGYQNHEEQDEGQDQVAVEIPGAETRGWGFANNVNKAYTGQPSGYRENAEEVAAQSQANSRRGHHHRHSMSHNFFPFIDTSSPRKGSNASLSPNQALSAKSPFSPGSSSGVSPNTPHSATSSSTPRSVPALASSTSRHRHTSSDQSLIPSISLRSKYSHVPAPARLVLAIVFHLPVLTQIALLAAIAEVGLGASLWVGGQAGESLAVTGLGYLVVFDALAALSSVIIEGNARGTERLWDIMQGRRAADNGVRYPFGTARVTTLSHFAQCVYLLFSAVYVCKESIEHVLLLHGPDEEGPSGMGDASHGAAHGTMGHGEGIAVGSSSGGSVFEWEDMGVLIPTKLLTLSIVACLFTAIALGNHASLTEAVGSTTYSLRPRVAQGANKSRISTSLHNAILSNPFTLTVLVFSFALATASLLIPAQQLAPLDKVVALLQSIAMFYIAYPAAVATGKVLLQTAPMASETGGGEMNALRRTLEEIENHPSVVYLPPPHIWQLTPHPPPVLPPSSSKPSSFGRRSIPPSASSSSSSGETITTIITLNIQVKQDASEKEILELTSWSREKCLTALLGAGVNISVQAGSGQNTGKGRQRQVELTVQVMRFEEARALQAETDHHGHGHSHGGHDHGHDHSHGHNHEHKHGESDCNGHAGHLHEAHGDHAHQDSHNHAGHQDHSHSSQSHSHDHGSNNHGHHH